MGTVFFQHVIHKTSSFLTGPSTYVMKVLNFFTTGASKVKLEKAVELAELGFYKKKNGFEGAQEVLDFYNKTFKKTSPVESQVILPHASAEVIHPREMEHFAVAEVIDPQEAEESSITIVKPTKVIYGNIIINFIYFNCGCAKLIRTHFGLNRPGATIPGT
jgi:hypothetical protein